MIRKKRMSKGIAKILSGLLVFGMVAGLVPAAPGGTVHAKAADVSEPGVTAYATKEQLMTAFTPDASGTNTNVGKLLFGKNASGTAQDWYILGKDNGVQEDNTIIFAASPMATVNFNGLNKKDYMIEYGTYADGDPAEVCANHYGASNLRETLQRMASDKDYFSDAEQTLMQATTVTTTDKKAKKDYTTTDKLYALEGVDDAIILKAGSNNSVQLQRSVYWSEDEFWLRSPYESSYGSTHDYTANYTSTKEQKVSGNQVDEIYAIRPATNLDLSNVLFASAFSIESRKIEKAMTLRLDGKNKGIGTATYNALTKEIKVNRGNTADTVHLIVQYKADGQETFYGQPIEVSQDLHYEDVDLSKCKIWLETTSGGMIYAVEATEENGGTTAEEHTGSHLIVLPQGATWTGINSLDNNLSAGYYYLTDNVNLTETWIPQNNVVLCLNGKKITMNAKQDVIFVMPGRTFTLTDCQEIAGEITHNKGKTGRGINNEGTFIMCGGVISNNDNSLGTGGGVYNEGCFELSGSAVISGNNAEDEGGGIYNTGTLIMSGGTIEKNRSGRGKGGGIYSNGNIVLSGSPNIAGNTAANLYLASDKLVSASGLATGVRIGVNKQIVQSGTTPVTITNDIVKENYFVSENSAYETGMNSEGYVVMNLKDPSLIPLYALTVENGTGSGNYADNTTITIMANAPETGKVFDKWELISGDAVIADVNNATTTVTTKISPSRIKAVYRDETQTPAPKPNPEPTPNPNPEPTPTPNPEPNPEPKPEPTPTPAPNQTPEASTPTPDPAPATTTPAASTTAAPAASAPAQVMYDILDGAGSSWTQNTDGSLAIRGSGEISKFREVKVDGVTVDPVNYTVTEGSTIITFKPEYLKSLPVGNHSFELVWTDGTAATNFTVAENADQSAKSPKTGEDFSMALCTALLMVSCAGLAGIFAKRKRNHAR